MSEESGIPALYSDLYFTCSSGLTPAKICPTQHNHMCKEKANGEFPYLIHYDTATQNTGDFFCRWTLVLAAAVAAAGVVTGGAALVALAAVAVVASGTLCGGMMAPFRKWVGYSTLNTYGRGVMPQKWKSDLTLGFALLGGAAFSALVISARSSGLLERVLNRVFPPQSHDGGYSLTASCQMICPIGGVITYAPGITGFWSALAYTARNVGFAVLEGIFWGKFASAGGQIAGGKAVASFGQYMINVLFLQAGARTVGAADQVFVEGMLRDGKKFSETGEYAKRGATMFEQPFISMHERINNGYYTGSYAKDAHGNIIEDAQNYHGAGAFVTDFYYSCLSLMGLKAIADVSAGTKSIPLETLSTMKAQIKALTQKGKGILFERLISRNQKLINAVEGEAVFRISEMSASQRGPCLTGILDTITQKIFFGENFNMRTAAGRAAYAKFVENAHPIIKQRIKALEQGIKDGTIKSNPTDGTPGAHSELVALDKALKAREKSTGKPVTEENLGEFDVHNRSMSNNRPNETMHRCGNCRVLTDGVNVVGHD